MLGLRELDGEEGEEQDELKRKKFLSSEGVKEEVEHAAGDLEGSVTWLEADFFLDRKLGIRKGMDGGVGDSGSISWLRGDFPVLVNEEHVAVGGDMTGGPRPGGALGLLDVATDIGVLRDNDG